ncbi:MAG: hypothetical protein RL660_1925 [Bacteroidota bacterium]|jgi:hypothetical protein
MNINFLFVAYCIYLPVALLLTWYTAHTLFKNARVFMLDIFHNKEDIALSTNKLFEIGFYLVNIGFALLILHMDYITNATTLFEKLSYKLGGFAIYLGLMLFANMYMFFRGRKAARHSQWLRDNATKA